MNAADYQTLSAALLREAADIQEAKQSGYIMGSGDVLANFKRAAEAANIEPGQAFVVFMRKHFDAICAILARPELPVSEAPIGRFADLINYCLLGYALLVERENIPEAGLRE